MRHLVAYVGTNRPGKKDASGAFVPEALNYAKHWGRDNCTMVEISNIGKGTSSARRWRFGETLDGLASAGMEYDVFSFFGHGTYYSIQLGYQRKNVGELASVLACVLKRRCKVILYSCSTASNGEDGDSRGALGPLSEGGFADKLRGALMVAGINADVYGHKSAGHTTYNPFWGRFTPDCASVGGEWVIRPRTEYWDEWVKALKRTELRFEFPHYGRQELHEWLQDYAGDAPLVRQRDAST